MNTTSSGPTSATKNDFDPQAPCIGSDGLEYEDLAARIEGRPAECWRNSHILAARSEKQNEARVRAWIDAYDGTEGIEARRHAKANLAIDSLGRGLRSETVGNDDDTFFLPLNYSVAVQVFRNP